ncbi:hypothetical protein PInf_021356 [Phytophthora infestans]|nr:hypothetical protein PInf_021356 [Phytophthora infestans]
MLVKQEPVPTTLEQAVDKATAIDDPIDNVARGMVNIDGRSWNGRFWKPTKKVQKARQSGSYDGGKRGSSEKRGKVRVVQSMADSSEESDSDEELPQPKTKKRRAAIRKTKAPTHSAKDEPQLRTGCPDPEAKARNDAYLATRKVQSTSATGNDERA